MRPNVRALLAFLLLPGSALAQQPGDRFADLERRLLDAERVEIGFRVTSEGAFEADLRGTLAIDRARETLGLAAEGHFGGQPAELFVERAGTEYTWGNASSSSSAVVPRRLAEAILVGITRMGVLHNLAMLTAAAPPDHADGGVAEWVVVEGFRGVRGEPEAVAFDLVVAGEPSGSATLLIGATGAPVVRHQTVLFPEGEMRVVERYENVTIQEDEMIVQVRDLAERYTAAWNSGDPAEVASLYAPQAALTINGGEPAVGRDAVTEVARSFMTSFPDMELLFDGIERAGDRYHYRWTFIGTNTGPGGTGKRVHFSGYEAWKIGEDGLVTDSLGNFDAEEYARQLEHGVEEGEGR